ncbi:CBS domain-containing protein [Thermomonospora cellulosilytica]|uniref:Restriction system protein n=1 Tax=Thermomonospora cellulosilytica TaxID=1411118 RepID=A0A7W3R914_9ACTN|nr:CBS domain-containing protein [Thermomonospora cellulosilytica]MBA9004154.1 restriction system protein [Thermomonospora cellulosilytica]
MAEEVQRAGRSAAWMVRGGWHGEREAKALTEGLVIAGWNEMGDLSGYRTRAALSEALRRAYPDAGRNVIGNWTGQLWRFTTEMREGDLVVMPLKTRPGHVAVGRIAGPYEYRTTEPEGFRQIRRVDWIRTDVSKERIRADLVATLGSLLTICRLSRNEAARRIAHLAEHGEDPGLAGQEEITSSDDLLEDAAGRSPDNPRKLTIRNLLEHWGLQRRTSAAVEIVKADLAEKGLTTRPPFTEGPITTEVALVPLGAEPGSVANAAEDVEDTEDVADPQHMALRLGSLPAPLVSVPSTADLTYVKTLMLTRQFSQLAVIDDDGTYRGAVSWESIGRAHVASGNPTLQDAITPALVVDHDALLLEQIPLIYERGYVFVRHPDRQRVTGIITAADLSLQFGELARPFVLIEEAENRLRRAADENFTVDELRDAVQPHRRNKINHAADFNFGDYYHLLKDPGRWTKLGWNIDQQILLGLLEDVRVIRNDLMHFSPDPLSPERYDKVNGLLTLLRTVDPRP